MSNDASYNVTADELRQFIEQYEQLESEKNDLTEQQKDIMSEAKARGMIPPLFPSNRPCARSFSGLRQRSRHRPRIDLVGQHFHRQLEIQADLGGRGLGDALVKQANPLDRSRSSIPDHPPPFP